MKILLILILSISQCFAFNVEPVKKGQKLTKDGFFVDASTMKKFRKLNEENKLLKKEIIRLEDLAVVQEQRIEHYKKFALESEGQLRWEKTKGDFKGIGGFLIGVLATSAAAYAASRALR